VVATIVAAAAAASGGPQRRSPAATTRSGHKRGWGGERGGRKEVQSVGRGTKVEAAQRVAANGRELPWGPTTQSRRGATSVLPKKCQK